MASALRPLLREISMKLRCDSHALAVGLRPGWGGGPESGGTSLAGFEIAGGAVQESGGTPLAGFAGGRSPQALGGRMATLASFR